MMRLFLINSILVGLLMGCQPSPSSPTEINFYHWKTELDIDSAQRRYVDSLGCRRLYLRLFDVKWEAASGRAVPVAMLNYRRMDLAEGTEIIPTIFITNATLENTPIQQIDSLAANIGRKMQGILAAQLDTLRFPVREAQFDCDWSPQTKDKYFRLLKALRRFFPRLSATIRLHQVKFYTKTGVPPVDRGVLMFYNMGSIEKQGEENSILNLETARQYLVNFDVYPLDLDVALPLFYWGVQFRDGRIVQVLHEAEADSLRQMPQVKTLSTNLFEIQESCYINGVYVYKGDIVRTEAVDEVALKTSLQLLREQLPHRAFELILYHLDANIMRRHRAKELLKWVE